VQTDLFVWDDNKAVSNLKAHRVSFDEALTVFADPFYKAYDDPDHSSDEDRYIAIGQSLRQRILVVAYKYDKHKTRIISAREATRREKHSYEEKT
jgi:uncharacterized DUF497 family protein